MRLYKCAVWEIAGGLCQAFSEWLLFSATSITSADWSRIANQSGKLRQVASKHITVFWRALYIQWPFCYFWGCYRQYTTLQLLCREAVERRDGLFHLYMNTGQWVLSSNESLPLKPLLRKWNYLGLPFNSYILHCGQALTLTSVS